MYQKPPAKSPAFSFYAKDFVTGTATMSLAERGAYVTLLAHQWDAGSVPGADLPRLSRLLGCSVSQARQLWAVVGAKFEVQSDGGYLNTRLEQERRKQTERRQKLAENGGKGGAKTAANKRQLLQQELKQNSSLAFSSSVANEEIPPTPASGGRRPTRRELAKALEELTTFRQSERQKWLDSGGCPHQGSLPQQREWYAENGINQDALYQEKNCEHTPECEDQDDCLLLLMKARREHEASLLAGAVRRAG